MQKQKITKEQIAQVLHSLGYVPLFNSRETDKDGSSNNNDKHNRKKEY